MRSSAYNVTVEGFHTYFVADAGVWVHNDKATSHDDPPPPDPDGSGGSGGNGGNGGSGGSGSGSGGGSAPPPA